MIPTLFQFLKRHGLLCLATAATLFPEKLAAQTFWNWEWLPPFSRLRTEQMSAETRLTQLPPLPSAQFGPRIGWHSSYRTSPNHVEWVELDFGRDVLVDLVALVPTPPHSENLTPGSGFPLRFKLEAFSSQAPNVPQLLFDQTKSDFPNPGILPVAIPCKRKPFSKLRITANRLSGNPGRHFFSLGEVFLVDGNRNIAPELESRGVSWITASSSEGSRPDWGRINLVDGQSVLGLPEGAHPSPTLGFSTKRHSASQLIPALKVSVDLGQPYPLDELRLFPARPPDFSHSFNFGFPDAYRVELREAESSEPILLTPPDSGGYMGAQGNSCTVILGNSTRARHVTVFVLEPQVTNGAAYLALAELEVWSGGKNVALQKTVVSDESLEKEGWSASALVDGFTSRANILEHGPWLAGLSERRDLQNQLSRIQNEKEVWSARIQIFLKVLGAGSLLSVLVFFAVDRSRQRRDRDRDFQLLRRRFAQDLHDDIGSNLGGIVLMTEQALELTDNPQLRIELQSIRETAADSVDGLRQLVEDNRNGLGTLPHLQNRLQSLIDRSLRGVVVHAEIPPTACRLLSPPLHRDVLLWLKEAFHNIRRHAAAQNVWVSFTLSKGHVEIRVRDDGRGFTQPPPGTGNGLSNLRHRAAALGGQFHLETTPGKGTVLTLSLPQPKTSGRQEPSEPL